METKSFICINCPLGCPLTVTVENGEVKNVTGNTCKRGELIAMTANAFSEDVERSRKAGMTEHLSKPLNAETLKKAILRNI